MKLTNRQIDAELRALRNALHEAVTLVGQAFPPKVRSKCLAALSLIEAVLTAEHRELNYATWQNLDEEQIAAELESLKSAVKHVTDIVFSEQYILDLQSYYNALHNPALQENTRIEIEQETTAVESHFNVLRQEIHRLLLMQLSLGEEARASASQGEEARARGEPRG